MKFKNMFTTCFCSDSQNDNTEIISNETGFDRVKRMYTKTDFGFLSPEMHFLVYNSMIAVSASAIIGAFIHANQAKQNYLRKNVATQYESQYLAKRHLVDNMSLSAIRGGMKYGLKYGSFSSLYLLSTMTIANYNNKITIWEHIASGALVGGLCRINYGLKGMAAAASAGAVLGVFSGGILVFSLWWTNFDFKDYCYWQSSTYLESRRKQSEIRPQELLKR